VATTIAGGIHRSLGVLDEEPSRAAHEERSAHRTVATSALVSDSVLAPQILPDQLAPGAQERRGIKGLRAAEDLGGTGECSCICGRHGLQDRPKFQPRLHLLCTRTNRSAVEIKERHALERSRMQCVAHDRRRSPARRDPAALRRGVQ